MRVQFFTDAGEMLERAEAFLLQREAENNLLLGVAGRLAKDPQGAATICAVEDSGEIVMAGVQSKKWNLVVARGPEAAVDLMVRELSAKPPVGSEPQGRRQAAEIPGVSGPAETAARFAEKWGEATSVRCTHHTWLRIYETRSVKRPMDVNGSMSPATSDDLDLIVDWMIEFSKLIGDQNHTRREEVEQRLDAGHFFLWRDGGKVVSIAAWAGPTPNGVRINSVYTPIEFRNRGYASANVAALTQHLLDGGRKFVFLFTDLKNPTSNSIYQKIGYRAVCDFDDYRFG